LDNLFRRTITGVFIVVFTLGGFWLHPVSYFFTGLVILVGTMTEYYQMLKSTGIRPRITGGIITGVVVYTLSTLVSAGYLPARYLLTIVPLGIFLMISELYRKQDRPFDSLAHTFFPLFYLAVPVSLMPFSAFSQSGLQALLPHGSLVFSPGLIIGFFVLLWVNDSAAYLAGSTLGRHRLMERISPKKSWEGFFGGLIFSIAVAWLLSGWFGVVDTNRWLIIAVIIPVAGTFGDLFESMLKRSLGVKDSGNIMPGHGGFLDRFDSAVISFPLVLLFVLFFG